MPSVAVRRHLVHQMYKMLGFTKRLDHKDPYNSRILPDLYWRRGFIPFYMTELTELKL